MSKKQQLILDILANGGEMFGLDIIAASGGKLARGTVYVDLLHLNEAGMVTCKIPHWQGSKLGRPTYQITEAGMRAREAAR